MRWLILCALSFTLCGACDRFQKADARICKAGVTNLLRYECFPSGYPGIRGEIVVFPMAPDHCKM